MKTYFSKFFGDMIPVILGILIALLINDCRDKKADLRFIDQTTTRIHSELRENLKELQEISAEHHSARDTIRRYMEVDSVSIADLLNKMGGLRGVDIGNTAWKAFLGDKIDLVDPQSIILLTDIDSGKDNLKIFTNKLMNLIYEHMNSNNQHTKILLYTIIGDMLYTEETLIETHHQLLDIE